MSDEDPFDARVVEDALAFIDAFYASSSDGNVTDADDNAVSETDADADAPTSELDDAVRNLQRQLAALSPFTTTVQYACVSSPQSDELRGVQDRLDECRLLWIQFFGLLALRRFSPLEDTNVAGFLRRRLDEIITLVASGASERPLLESRIHIEEVSDKYFDHPLDGVAMRFRSGRFIPFKLSILSEAAWSVVADCTFCVPGRSQAPLFEHTDEILARFHDELDDTEGVTILRRAHLPDGSILICWTAVSAAPRADEYHPLNYMGDAETHQFGWVRVGRILDGESTRPRCYLESISDIAVRPSGGSLEEQEVNLRRFERFKAFMYAWDKRDAIKNRQLIENRMLDATHKESPSQTAHGTVIK